MKGFGGYTGFNRIPAPAAFNSAAVGVWTLQEAEINRRAVTWPTSALEIIVSDTFTGANTTTLASRSPDVLISPATGWVSHVGTVAINNNSAYCSAYASHAFGSIGLATVQSMQSNCTITSQIKWGDNSFSYGLGFVVFRYVDTGNFWLAGSDYDGSSVAVWRVYEVVNNVGVSRLGSGIGGAVGQTGQVQVVLNGSNIIVRFAANTTSSFTHEYSLSSSVHQSATRHGIYFFYDVNGPRFENMRFDNFLVTIGG